VNSAGVADCYTARHVGESVYGYKTLIEDGSGRILGAHLVGPHAVQMIDLFGIAIRRDLRADDSKSTIFAYPTGASDIGAMLQKKGNRIPASKGRRGGGLPAVDFLATLVQPLSRPCFLPAAF
jgi:hypothetical protein